MIFHDAILCFYVTGVVINFGEVDIFRGEWYLASLGCGLLVHGLHGLNGLFLSTDYTDYRDVDLALLGCGFLSTDYTDDTDLIIDNGYM